MAVSKNRPMHLLPKVRKGIHPLLYISDTLLAARGNSIYRFSSTLTDETLIGSFNEGWIKNNFARNPLYTRVLRQGFHGLASDHYGNLVGIVNKQLVFKNRDDKSFKPVFNEFRGSRPLRIEYSNGAFCFGEYFDNPKRDPVHIFSSIDGKYWNKVYTFPTGSIRHIHGILDDQIRNGSWVLTGDDDCECKIWFTNDLFKTLQPIVEGGQKTRAVNIIVRSDSLIIPMDSPKERNYIQLYNLKTDELEQVAEIPGSAFHSIETSGIMLVTTVTEPSSVNRTDAATVWGSLDGRHWKCVCELRRDFVPVGLQHIFRYAEIVLTPGENNTPYITAFGRSLSKMDNAMLVWEKGALRDFLRND